jgi:predicted TIM-barrel fold metal-dependent hydrolase
VEEVGAERLLFGSGAPRHPIQSALNAVLQADVSPEDKCRVLGGNACRLFRLDEEQLLAKASVAPGAQLVVPRGPIIDAHCHLDVSNTIYPTPDIGPAAFVEEMERFHVERSIVSSLSGIEYDIATGNRALAEAIDGYPSLSGLVVVNPNYLNLSCEEMDRYYQLDNFVGAKLHCYYSEQPTGSPASRALIAEVAKRGKPLLLHTDGPELASTLKEIAHAHPDLSIIVAHGPPEGIQAARETDNVYLDFCSSGPRSDVIREVVDVLGADRVLFGSDESALDRGFVLGTYADAGLTPGESKLVMYENAKCLFKL